MNIPINGKQIKDIFGSHCMVITYKDLYHFTSLHDLFQHVKYVFILYEQTKNKGHWILILKRPRGYEYFDSYGKFVDKALLWTNPLFRKKNKMEPYLSYLFHQSKGRLEFNQYQFQKKGATCGRWCILRALYSDMSIDEFYSLFKKLNDHAKNQAILKMTNFLFSIL